MTDHDFMQEIIANPSDDLALMDLSQACVTYGRAAAGLV